VTGAGGQIGVELVAALRSRYGRESVLATDVRSTAALRGAGGGGPFRFLDCTSAAEVSRALVEHDAGTIVHLASLLSAVGERAPARAIAVNSRGSEAVLATAAEHGAAVFAPSTIAVFGPSTPRDATPNETVLRPSTVYGVTKVYTELLGEYYAARYGVDFRSLRYPGIISHLAPAGGGTTDYAVDIFYAALREGRYRCFLGPHTALPMMYMPDCLRSTLELIDAPAAALTKGRVFNITALSFTPAELAAAIKRYLPAFEIEYAPDERQAIADSWPRSIDDSLARQQWGWQHRYDLDGMTRNMLRKLAERLKLTVPPALVNDRDD
jgi:threonine 3-dehydrogenase